MAVLIHWDNLYRYPVTLLWEFWNSSVRNTAPHKHKGKSESLSAILLEMTLMDTVTKAIIRQGRGDNSLPTQQQSAHHKNILIFLILCVISKLGVGAKGFSEYGGSILEECMCENRVKTCRRLCQPKCCSPTRPALSYTGNRISLFSNVRLYYKSLSPYRAVEKDM